MKYFFRVLIVLLLAVGVGLFVYSANYRQKQNEEQITLTTAKIGEATTKENTRQLVAENKEGDYQLYKDDGSVILCHNGKEQNVDNWYSYIATNKPELYYFDFDGDEEKELAIILSNSTSDYSVNHDYSNSVVVVKEVEGDAGKVFDWYLAGVDTWKIPFTQAIKCEMNQPVANSKYIQFVMCNITDKLIYDEKTGYSKNKYVYFALAEKSDGVNYASFDRWSRGATKYSIDKDGKIHLNIQVLGYYDEFATPQYVGDMNMEIIIRGKAFDILPNSISFITSDKYYCPDPRVKASSSWQSTITNSSYPVSSTDTEIKWIDAQFALSSIYSDETISFGDMESQIKNVDKVELSEGGIKLVAKQGYTFSQAPLKEHKFSVIINKGEKTEYDISEGCKLSKDKTTLEISFDNTYDRERLSGIMIKYGA